LAVLVVLLLCLPLWAQHSGQPLLQVVDTFFRTGALVFGGGHVVLPLLQAELVQPGWVDANTFVAGYGATQAVPGPLFTFAAFLGSVMPAAPSLLSSLAYAAVAVLAIFAPSFLLVVGVWPFWQQVQQHQSVQHALQGINAAVVGLLAAVLIQPMALGTLHNPQDMLLCFAAIVALKSWRWAPWVVVAACASLGWLVLT
jgi:chromate transporter